MNTPYIKQYDDLGLVANPITKHKPYLHSSPNRRERRAEARKHQGLMGNHKGVKLTVIGKSAYFRVFQYTPDGKRILHYLPKTK